MILSSSSTHTGCLDILHRMQNCFSPQKAVGAVLSLIIKHFQKLEMLFSPLNFLCVKLTLHTLVSTTGHQAPTFSKLIGKSGKT